MATFFVGPGGSDGAAGTSYGARWLTIGKALGASGIASGDLCYLSPGVYREVVTVAMTSATVATSIIGDVTGANTSGVPGEVRWTAFLTNDTTASSATALLTLAGRDFLSFSKVVMYAGTGKVINATSTPGSTDITFTDCALIGPAGNVIDITSSAGVALNWLFERCLITCRAASSQAIKVVLDRHTADYDANVIFRNCVIDMPGLSAAIEVSSTGAGAGFGGGVLANSCFLRGYTVFTTLASVATSIPCKVNNSIVWCTGNTGLYAAGTSGQITESYNLHTGAGTFLISVTAGTGTVTNNSYAILLHQGQERVWGGLGRPQWMPTADSPVLGFGVGASPPSVDILNRPRPSGSASLSIAAGPYERHDHATKETSVTDAGGVGIKITGPGDHDVRIPVNAAGTVVTVRTRFDTTHGTGTRPQAILLANPEIGVVTETKTAVGAVDTWETLTFSSFTPTAKGVVTIRLVSRPAAGGGIAYFDTFTVT